MKKEFVTYEQAVALKELGFDEICIATYDEDEYFEFLDFEQSYYTIPSKLIQAPLYQQAFRWFREKYQIDSWIYPNLNGLYSISNVRRGVGLGKVSEYQTYEEAELECLIKLIEIVKNK
jgi:hypothetical protein